MRRRLAVIVAADMVGYSRLMEADRAAAIAAVRRLRETLFQPELDRRGGELLKSLGDGWIFAFPSVSEAVEAAQAVQTMLAVDPRVQVRVAIHIGEIADDGADLYGGGLNIAARLQAEAPPGGVMISDDLHRQLDLRLAEGFAPAGTFELRNIARPVAAWRWRPAREGAGAADATPSIALEPLAVPPGDMEAAEAAADLREQLLERLARRTGVRVTAPEAAGGEADGRPTYALRGRLARREGRARLRLSLILRETAEPRWSESFEGPAEAVFALCDRAAEAADLGLRRAINARDGERFAALPDSELGASELRARAAREFYAATVESHERGAALLTRALQLDPGDAMSLAMRVHARTMVLRARFERPDPEEAARLEAEADAAVQAAPRADFVVMVRGVLRLFKLGDLAGARRDLERAERLDAGLAYPRLWRGVLRMAEGDAAGAARTLAEVLPRFEADPFRPLALHFATLAALSAGRAEAARAHAEEAVELRPGCRAHRLLLHAAQRELGEEAAAARTLAAAERLPAVADVQAAWAPVPEALRGLMARLAPSPAAGVSPPGAARG